MTRPNNILLTLLAALAASGQIQSANGNGLPRVVVNILVDQLRSDYMEAFMPLYGEGGWKKLLQEGRVYTGAEYPMVHTDRASAAATLSTGTTPAQHGIVGLHWVDRETLRPVYCAENDKQLDATKLSTSTVGDELKVASEGKALVVSVGADADMAILMAGHAADQVYWIDEQTGQWTTSSYYAGATPQWIKLRNTHLAGQSTQITWEPSSDLVGNFSYFLSGGMKQPFKHQMKGPERYRQWKTSGLVNGEVAAAVESLMRYGTVGMDQITDYLSISLYAGGYSLSTGDGKQEVQDTYVRLDDALERIMKALEQKVGKDNLLLTLTSTGYTEETNTDLSKYRIPTGTFDMKRARGLLAMYLRAVYGLGDLITTTYGTEIYLNHKTIEDNQINYTELLERCQDFLQQLAGVRDVYGSVRLLQGSTSGLARQRNNYHVQHSGDLTIEVMPGWHAVNPDSGHDQMSRASYVPFPIVFYGSGIKSERISDATTVDYIAPTLSNAMRIRAPNACDKSPLF